MGRINKRAKITKYFLIAIGAATFAGLAITGLIKLHDLISKDAYVRQSIKDIKTGGFPQSNSKETGDFLYGYALQNPSVAKYATLSPGYNRPRHT